MARAVRLVIEIQIRTVQIICRTRLGKIPVIQTLLKWIHPDRRIAAGLAALVFVTHLLSPNATSGDSHWVVPQIVSLLSEGNADLNEYPDLLREHSFRGLDCVDREYRITFPDPAQGCPPASRYYARFPIGPAVVALPPMVAMDLILRVTGQPTLRAVGNRGSPAVRAFLRRDYVHTSPLVEMALASFLIGLTAAFVYLTGREFLSRRMAVVLTLLFAYGTAAWSTGSRAMWQHGPEMLMLAAAVYLLVKARAHPSLASWSAVPLVFAYFIRPTGAIALVLLGLFILIHHRERFGKWALLAVVTAAPFVACNFASYRRPLEPYFTQQSFLEPALRNAGDFLVALAGQCFSPSRGVLVFSPFLLFAVLGVWMAFRRHWQTPLAYPLAAILLLHWIVISAFADWTAGVSYGPRYFSDVMPIFIFFLIPVLATFETGRAPRMAVAAFATLALIAIAIHFRGAVNWDVERWNEGEVTAARVWDWKDPQFLRGLFH
jgi:hypothetical protein